jgi:hypothetical protein
LKAASYDKGSPPDASAAKKFANIIVISLIASKRDELCVFIDVTAGSDAVSNGDFGEPASIEMQLKRKGKSHV